MNWRFVICMAGALALAGCELITETRTVRIIRTGAPTRTVTTTKVGGKVVPDPATTTIPPSAVLPPPPAPNGWAGRSAGSGKVLKCGGEDPEAVFGAFMVGAGRNARVERGLLTFTGTSLGFTQGEEVSFPVRRPANYMDDPRCVGPDGTGGLWMSAIPEQNLSFFILPERGRGVQVNQLLPPKLKK